MPIASPIGFLDVVNATLRASQVESTSRLTVANTAATKNFSVGDKFHIDKDSVDPVSVTGNVVASGIKISNLTISPIFDLGAVSNVGNTTANTLQFANATTGFTTTANVEIGGNITLTSNAQVKVGSNVLAEYTGPHPREPKEIPIKKYPEIVFDPSKVDGNDTTNVYVQAGYVASSSTKYTTYSAIRAFDDRQSALGVQHHWSGSSAKYNTSNGNWSGDTASVYTTNVGGVNKYGEWLQIEFPHKIKYNYSTIKGPHDYVQRQPRDGYILGSNDLSGAWTTLHQFTGVTRSSKTETVTYTPPSEPTNAFKYFRLVIEAITASNGQYAGVDEWDIYGSEEPAPPGDLSLDTTLKSTFDSVRSNNYVMYFDGDEFIPGDNNSNNLVTGSSVSVVHHNATYDSTGKYWTLDGSTESNVTTGDLGLEGDTPHTVSMWVNSSNLDANVTTQQLFNIGSGYDKALVRVDDTQIAANTWHNVTYAYQGEGGSKVTYLDGRKVEEEKVENTFGEYPPFAMTDYEIGGYRVSASSEYTSDESSPRRVWNAYADGGAWMTEFDVFGRNASSNNNAAEVGEVTITDTDGTSHIGVWTILETPFRFRASYLVISSSVDTRRPESVVILGSNDNENWDLLYTNTSVPDDNDNTLYFNSTKGYKYHMFMVKNLDPNGEGALYISRLRYFGDKEGDLTRFPEPTKVLKYPTIITKNGNGEAAVNFPTHTGAPYDSYAMRGHVIKASESIASYPAYAAFNGETHVALGTVWVGGYQQYGTGSGASAAGEYGGSRNLKTDLGTGGSATSNGSWLYIEMPHKIKVTSTKIVSYDTSPSTGHPPDYVVIYGTNDPSSSGGWNVVDNTYATNSSGIPNSQVGKTWAVSTASSPTAYKYFALVIVKTNGVSTYSHAIINDWQLIGTQEDIGTPAIVGGPFAGKVANFRVYDKYLSEERIQEIYDAQKDAFGHKKSSMTLYKGRIGVGTTEPEGALTVLDEPHALEKFPARAISADDSYVEGDGETVIRAADGSGYQAFDGLTSTSWTAAPTRKTRLSEEVDFGAWLKIQTPESMSLKKAEFESNPYWSQVGSETYGGSIDNTTSGDHFGRAVACSHDGTRVIVGAYVHSTNQGLVKVYDWNRDPVRIPQGGQWTQVGSTLTGTADNDLFGRAVAISGDGNIIAVAAPREHVGSDADKGTVRVYYLSGSTWTILPDSGALTGINSPFVDVFTGETAEDRLGQGGVKLSYDGYTIAMGEAKDDTGVANIGRIRVYTYSNGAWSQKGSTLLGNHTEEEFGQGLDMSEDGNHLIIGTKLAGGTSQPPRVEVYKWNGSAWAQKGSSLTYADTGDGFGPSVSISNDGNTIAIGIKNADAVEGAPDLTTSTDDTDDNTGVVYVYHWNGSAWGTPYHLVQPGAGDHDFGDHQVMSGDGKRLIVGAGFADYSGGTNSGRLYTFEFRGDSWLRRPVPMVGADGGNNAYLGMGPTNSAWSHAISRDGSVIVAGESGFYTNGVAYSGRVKIYNMPSTIKSIWGSNDDVNWTKITTAPTREEATSNVAGLAFGYDDRLEFKNLDNLNYYKYHAIVADAFTRLKEVKLFGVRKQGSSTLHDGTLTLTKNLDVPRIGAPPNADNTPRRDRLILEYNTSTNPIEDGLVRDTSGRGFNGNLVSGAYYDVSEKALAFDGTDDYITVTAVGVKGSSFNTSYSLSMWARMTNDNSASVFFTIGSSANGKMIGFRMQNGTTGYLVYHYGGDYITTPYTYGNSQQWRHVVATWDNSQQRIYIDGVLAMIGTASSSFLDMEDDPDINLGFRPGASSSERFKGYQSNPKIYDCTLTAQEVKTLYDMGRCDEGHHVVDFSKTRVGIGLGDGKISKAALDVRGDAFFRGVVSTGLPAIFGSVDNVSYVAQSSRAQNITTVEYTQGPSMLRPAGGLLFPVAGMYIVHFVTHCWYSGGGVTVRSQMEFRRYNYAGTIYANRGLEYDIQTGTTSGNSDMHHAATFFVHANAGDYATLTHATSPDTTRNYQNDWNYVSAACVSLDEPQYSSA